MYNRKFFFFSPSLLIQWIIVLIWRSQRGPGVFFLKANSSSRTAWRTGKKTWEGVRGSERLSGRREQACWRGRESWRGSWRRRGGTLWDTRCGGWGRDSRRGRIERRIPSKGRAQRARKQRSQRWSGKDERKRRRKIEIELSLATEVPKSSGGGGKGSDRKRWGCVSAKRFQMCDRTWGGKFSFTVQINLHVLRLHVI